MAMNPLSLDEKLKVLHDRIRGYRSLAIAYSGGADSTLLLAVASRVSEGNVIAVTAVSPLQASSEIQAAVRMARSLGVEHHRVHTCEMTAEEFVANNPDRCYVCKKIIFTDIRKKLSELGIFEIAHGANLDDLKDYRPGMKAAEELRIAAPLIDAGMTKNDIRELSRRMALPTWNKPPAACLASRIPYGKPITTRALEMIESAENVLSALGFKEFRVRHDGEAARIELRPSEFSRLLAPERRLIVIGELRRIGYSYITMDLEGYSSGRLNRSIG